MNRRGAAYGQLRRGARSPAVASGGGSPPTVDAGADDSFDMLGADPYTLDGSGTGADSYLWTVDTAPVGGTATFDDDTDPLSTVTFDTHGEWVLDLAATNSGGTVHDTVTITVAATLAVLLARMAVGSRQARWYEVDVTTTTVTGEGVSSWSDAGTGEAATQAVDGNRPSKEAGAGPLGLNCITFQDGARNLLNNTISIAAGKELFVGCVAKLLASATAGRVFDLRQGPSQTSNIIAFVDNVDIDSFRTIATATAQQVVTITSPVLDTNWASWEWEFRTGTVVVCRRDGATVSPAFTTATGTANAVESLTIGSASSGAGGSIYLWFMFEAPTIVAGTACLSERDAIRYLVEKQTGL